MPITWRNIQAPDLRGVVDIQNSAMQGLDKAFSGFQSMIDTRMNQQKAEGIALKNSNEQDFRDYLAGFKTPEELAAAQASGALGQKVAGYGGVIDRTLAREGANNQIASLRDSILKKQEYDNTQRDILEESKWNALYEKAYKRDRAGVDQGLAAEDLRLEGKRSKDLYDILQGYDEFGLRTNQDKRSAAELGMRQAEHGVRMKALQEEQAQREQLKLLDQEVRAAYTARNDQVSKYNSGFDALLKSHGVGIADNGSYDFSKIIASSKTQEEALAKITAAQQAIDSFDKVANPGEISTYLRDFSSRLTQDKRFTLPIDKLMGAASTLDNAFLGGYKPSATDQLKLTKMKTELDTKYQADKNPYIQEMQATSPIDVRVNELLDKYRGKNENGVTTFFGYEDSEDGLDKMREITSLVGKGYPLPLIERALMVGPDEAWETEEDLTDIVDKFVKDNPTYKKYEEDASKYKTESIEGIKDLTKKYTNTRDGTGRIDNLNESVTQMLLKLQQVGKR